MANDGSGNGRNPDGRFQDETVDDILAGILNRDGSFNEEFGALLTKYLGDDAAHVASLRGVDLSSRLDEPRPRMRVEYQDMDDRNAYYDGYGYGPGRDVDRRIEEKMPEDVRYLYAEATSQVQRPEFTASGGVRYPSIGVGDSEERVVYDAEWEERARQEAARLQRVREDRMLRGDSTYVRSFVAGGRPMRGRSPFIDPLSSDDDFDEPSRGDRRRQNDDNSFFQEGPPVRQARNRAGRQRNTGSAGGRTGSARTVRGGAPGRDDVFESFSDSYEKAERSRAAWMQPDDEISSGRKRRNDRRRDQLPRITSTLRDDYDRMSDRMEGEYGPARWERQPEPPAPPPPPELDPMGERFAAAFRRNRPEEPPAEEEPQPERVDPAELAHVREQRQDLRSTVSEIVDKYDRRSEEEAAAREKALREEEERQAAERLARESFLRNLSSEVASALDEENDPDGPAEDYDDLTGVTGGRYVSGTDALRAFAAAHGGSLAPSGPQAAEPAQDYSIYLDPLTEPAETPERAPSGQREEAAPEAAEPEKAEPQDRQTGQTAENGADALPGTEAPPHADWTPDFSVYAEPVTASDEAPEGAPPPDAEPGPVAGSASGTDPVPDTEPAVEAESVLDMESAADAESEPETEPAVEAEPEPETEPVMEAEPEPETEPVMEAEPEPETEPAVEAEPEPETEPVMEAEPVPETKASAAPDEAEAADDPDGFFIKTDAPGESDGAPVKDAQQADEWMPDFSMFLQDLEEPDVETEEEFLFPDLSALEETAGDAAGDPNATEDGPSR